MPHVPQTFDHEYDVVVVGTGGAGFACPAGIWSLIMPVTFFAIRNSFLF